MTPIGNSTPKLVKCERGSMETPSQAKSYSCGMDSPDHVPMQFSHTRPVELYAISHVRFGPLAIEPSHRAHTRRNVQLWPPSAQLMLFLPVPKAATSSKRLLVL